MKSTIPKGKSGIFRFKRNAAGWEVFAAVESKRLGITVGQLLGYIQRGGERWSGTEYYFAKPGQPFDRMRARLRREDAASALLTPTEKE